MAGKVAFVTGASRGIGAAIARRLGADGYVVAVGYAKSADQAHTVVAEIAAAGGTALPVAVDIAARDSIREALAQTIEALGPVEILVNNAAIAQEKPFLTITDADWDAMLATNLRGPFAFSQEVLPGMIERKWGRIVNIVSIGGQWGGVNQIHYASAKAGLIGLTRSLAKTFGGQGVTVNAVSPGLVATDMTAAELDSDAGQEKVRGIPAGRIGGANEIASAVAYLCEMESGYITGQTLNVNGGMYFG